MTTVLVTLSLLLTGALVLVLAVSLIRILTILLSIGNYFIKIKAELVKAERNTQPLNASLVQLNAGLGAISEGFTSVKGHLQ